jgi:3-hydroxyacyl-CoA dehydrogenase
MGDAVGIETLGVVGAGVMGSDIAFVAALAGKQVIICDVDATALSGASDRVTSLAARAQARGKLGPDDAAALSARVATTSRDEDLAVCDLAIEAVSERMDLKRMIFARLDAILRPGALIASNTSGLSITELAACTTRPEAVLGIHFFNPAAVMRLVELIEGRQTSADAMDTAEELVRQLGKAPVRVRECPGFLVNRILVRAMAEAYRHATTHGLAPAAVDAAVAESGPAPMGPFALGDLIGLDTMDHIQRDLEQAYGERFTDAGAIASQVAQGRLGRKNGQGFLEADEPAPAVGDEARAAAQRYYYGALDEALRCHDDAIAARPDIDLAMRLGAGWAIGPLAWADGEGVAGVLGTMQELSVSAGNRFQPTSLLRARAADGCSLIDDGDIDAGTTPP